MTTETKSESFYNVMPEAVPGKPNTKTFKPATSTVASTTITMPKKHGSVWRMVLPIIGVIVIISSAVVVYLLMRQNGTPAADTETLLDSTTPTNPEVTTPADWLERNFNASVCTELSICGDKADPDRDGLDNRTEYDIGTGPNNADSDSDGIADGDEKNIFSTDPLLTKTFREGQYTDPEFVKGGYDITTNSPYTDQRIAEIKAIIKEKGLHQPTLTTLGTLSFELYNFTDPNVPPLPANTDISPQAKLDRDSQRQSTIKKIGAALLAYKAEKKSYPAAADFVVMADMIKSYNTVATNYNDPISREPYMYGYQSVGNNASFVLSYYSETQNQLIKYSEADAQKNVEVDNSKAFDEQRKADLENIASALKVYSNTQLDPQSPAEYVFPPADQYKKVLVPRYITAIPTDPKTKLDYAYQTNATFDTFTLKATLQNPPAGNTGYLCNQEECKLY